MIQKRKISVRKVLQFLLTIIVTAGCVVAVSSASKIEAGKFVNNIDIRIKNEKKCRFIDKDEVMNILVNNRHVDIKHIPVSQLDLHSMEQIVAANPWVADAEVYVDNLHNLHVDLTQRVPVARVFEENGSSYYIDTALKTMPLSGRYIYYTTVVTGVPVTKDDSAGMSVRAQVTKVVRFIESSAFWKAQVSQIIMSQDNTFELVPVLGHQRILIGDTSMLEEKFANLYAFYKNVSNRIGWDKYDVIDVRFKGQVVASPALPWKAPVDKMMSSMSWVKNIVGKDSADMFKRTPVPVAQASAPVTVKLPATPKEHTSAGPTTKPVVKTSVGQPKAEKKNTLKAQAYAPPAKTSLNVVKDRQSVKKDAQARPADKKEANESKPKYLYKDNNDHH